MNPKEIVIEDPANYPHKILKCLSCSIAGLELLTLFPEEDVATQKGGYTEAQLDLIEQLATTHARKHTNPQIRVYNYTRP
jgi:hypothetical protein